MDDDQDEWVDVVDAEDHVVGRATRADVRKRNLLHRAVYIFVTNTRGELFVHRRTAAKDVYPGHYDVTVGGVVAAGEDYDAAATRELAEELGVVDTAVERLGALRYEDADTQVQGVVYHVRHDGPFVLQFEEIARGEFVSFDAAERVTREERCCPDGVAALRAFGARLRGGS